MVRIGDYVRWAHGNGDQRWSKVIRDHGCGQYDVVTADNLAQMWQVKDDSELVVRDEGYEWGEKPDPRLAVHPAASSGAQREKLNALPYDLVPFQEIADAYSRVAEKGAVKYAPWNWSKGLSRVQLVGSLLRHTWAYLRGEECDKETGLNHTDHILWNAVALVHNVRWNLEDGRRGEPERNYKNPLDKADKSE